MLTVITPGPRTLIEDLGRPGYEHLGVPSSGAADPDMLRLANRIVGNTPDAAALEVTLHGPTLTFDAPAVVAYAGPAADLHLNGARVPAHHTINVDTRDTLTIGALHHGVFGYLAVAGGIDVPTILNSRSHCTMSGLGPAPLAAGDVLGFTHDGNSAIRAALGPRPTRSRGPIRFVRGPHAHLFTDHAYDQFHTTRWKVSPASSRVGVRLTGASLAAPDMSLPSLGMITGAVQVPPSGDPIVLGPDHGTTGGYPVIAVIVTEDMGRLMQHRPGEPVLLCEVSITDHSHAPNPADSHGVFVEFDRLHG